MVGGTKGMKKNNWKKVVGTAMTLSMLSGIMSPWSTTVTADAKLVNVKQEAEYPYSMDIDGNNVTKQLSEDLYGLFYEDINSAADGGLYPEMVKNYSFENAYLQGGNKSSSYFKENGYETVGNYKLHWEATPSAGFAVEDTDGLNDNNIHYAVITGDVVLKNGGFAPTSNPNGAAMPIKPYDKENKTGTYTFSAFVKADSGYSGNLVVELVDANGELLADPVFVELTADGEWNKVSAELVSNVEENTKGKMVLSVEGAADRDKLCLDMVSIVPHDSYGYGNLNYACGVGIRQDLLELMMDLNPQFMRFPGGCIVEGFNWEGLYDWRDTIGPLEERKINTNRWENWGNSDHSWGYMQSFGFGYHEVLTLCEEYDMEALPILNAGLLCQWETGELSGNIVDAKTGADLDWFIEMATDLLDYCWGDAKTNEWAARRAENGHPEPFDLKYLGIGNENLGDRYFENFEVMKQEVEAYAAANYPGRTLTIISSAGPYSSGSELEYAYDRLEQNMPGETLVDEHYYESESFMYNQSDRYDYYDRKEQGGSEIFVGEYAVKNNNKYNTALAEACYITGLERNADIVTNISYAPMLCKIGNVNWTHDLIYFDEFETAKSTNYYVQQMFGQNYGTELIGTELVSAENDYSNYGSPVIGMSSSEGYIDKITVYDADGKTLLEDDFEDDSTGWEAFNSGIDTMKSDFAIKDGKLYFNGTSGMNLVYLPQAVEEKWTDYKIVVEGAVKTAGSDGFLIGAGYDKQYYWYNLGSSGAYMQVTRPYRNQTALTRKTLGNNFANKYYNTGDRVTIQTNDVMDITFNFGTDGKLEGNYTSAELSDADTAKYDFSGELHPYQTDIYQVVNKDDENVYIKLVNADNKTKEIQLNFSHLEIDGNQAMVTMLKGGLNDANAIGNEIVAPVSSTETITSNQLVYELPEYSVNVIRVPLVKKQPVVPQKETVTLTYKATAGGKITGQAVQTIEKGAAASTVTAVADTGYKFVKWDDGVTTATRTDSNVTVSKIYTAVFEQEVIYRIPTWISLNSKKLTMGVKEKVTLKANVTGESQKNVKWNSNKPKVVSVSSNGKLTGKKPGTAVISASLPDGKKVTCKVTVKKAPKKISLKVKSKTLKKGKSFQLKVNFPKNTASYKVIYKSSKPSVVKVTNTGKVTAKKKGTAKITVKTFNGKMAVCKVKVK